MSAAYAIGTDAPPALLSPALVDAFVSRLGAALPPKTGSVEPLVELDTDEAITLATRYLKQHAPEAVEGSGGDATTYAVACRVLDYGVSPEIAVALMLEHWFGGCGWDADDLAVKVRNAERYRRDPVGVRHPAADFSAVTPDEDDDAVATRDARGKQRSTVDILVSIGMQHRRFTDLGGDPYATVTVGDHVETYAVNSSAYRDVLAAAYFRLTGAGANRNALADATTTIGATAKFGGEPSEPVYIRVGETAAGAVVIDTGGPEWDAIVVTAEGWRSVPRHPIAFRRGSKTMALPTPTTADISRLWRHVHCATADRPLLLAWLLSVLRCRGPFPPLFLVGLQGSGKTSAARVLKTLVDASEVLLRSRPANEDGLLVAAVATWLVALDNLSGVSAEISDALCRLATGGGRSSKKLYCDSDEVLTQLQRPVLANGLDELAGRADLAERAVCITLEPIPESERATEVALAAMFAEDGGMILAALLDGVALALRDAETIDIGPLPRMADFAKWAAAGLPALGYSADEFMTAYRRNQETALAGTLDSSPLSRAISSLVTLGPWEGSPTDLLAQLTMRANDIERRSPAWPRTPQALSNALNRITPSLRQAGIEFDHRKSNGARVVRLSTAARQ